MCIREEREYLSLSSWMREGMGEDGEVEEMEEEKDVRSMRQMEEEGKEQNDLRSE